MATIIQIAVPRDDRKPHQIGMMGDISIFIMN